MGKGKRKKQKYIKNEKPRVMDTKIKETLRLIWGIEEPTLEKMKLYRTKDETFRLLKTGKLKLKNKPNRQIFVEYDTEATDDILKREKSKYIKDLKHIRQPLKKRKIRKEYVYLKGHDKKGNMEFWKVRLKDKLASNEAPYIYQSNFSNNRYRILDAAKKFKASYDKRNQMSGIRPGLLDRMPDEFLSLFDEDAVNEDGKKRRYTVIETLDMDPNMICEMIEPFRTPICKRLKKFEQEREERKRTKLMSEEEKQIYVRKLKIDEEKKKYLNILLKFLKHKINDEKNEMINIERKKFKYELKKFRWTVDSACEIIMRDMNRYWEIEIQKEVEDALNMRRKTVKEEIFMTAQHKEAELKYSYEKMFLPAKLSAQQESYQLDMSSYIQFWTKKTRDIEKKVHVQKEYLKKQLETSKILQASEHISLIAKSYEEQAKKAEGVAKYELKEALLPLKEKVEAIENIKRENKRMEDSIRCYAHVLPEFVRKLKEFTELTQNDSITREQFLEALDNIEAFRQELLQQHEEFLKRIESESTMSKVDLSKTKSFIENNKEPEIEEEEEEIVLSMAHRILSDGDLEESAKQLLKVKFIIVDLLKRVIPRPPKILPPPSEVSSRCIRCFSNVEHVIQSEDETYVIKTTKRAESFSVLDKLKEVNEKIDFIFQIVGNKYSIPNLVKVGEYLNKRTDSVYKILKNHRDMLEHL